MKHKIIIAALGALAAITGLDASGYAQARQEFTLSGDSLDVENLTVRDDYKEFFRRAGDREDTSLSIGNSNNYEDDGIFSDGDDGVWQISEQVELQVNEPISPPVFPAFPHQEGASIVDDVDRVELQYELSQ